jgi:hypothetical protein
VSSSSGQGPCDVFDVAGRLRESGIRSLQRMSTSYLAQMERACDRHPGCYTDERAMETFDPTDRDLAAALNHVSIAGHRRYAEIAWSALPEEITSRP